MDLFEYVGLPPFIGGKLSYAAKYKLLSIKAASAKENLGNLDASSIQGKGPAVSENPTHAIFLVEDAGAAGAANTKDYDSFTSIPAKELAKIKGASWYAVLKMLDELVFHREPTLTLDAEQKKFVDKFVTLKGAGGLGAQSVSTQDPASGDATDATALANHNKAVIIGFIHGVHAYALAKGVTDVPDITQPMPERYRWVLNYLQDQEQDGKAKATLDGIWSALYSEYLKGESELQGPKEALSPYHTLSTKDGITKFISTPSQQDSNAASISTRKEHEEAQKEYEAGELEGLESIALKRSIHAVLLPPRFKHIHFSS